MAVFGSTINPALGRVDYSPLAQGLAQGGQLAAQGLSNFGTSVAQGIQTFLKKQEDKQNEQEGINFIKAQFPGLGDAEAKAGLKAAGGAAAFVKFKTDMAQNQMAQRAQALQLAEFERTAAERSRLAQAMTASPAQMAMMGGATFEQLPTGSGAFLSTAPANTSEFVKRAQEAKIDPSVWLPQAIQFSQLEENVGKAKALLIPRPEKTPSVTQQIINTRIAAKQRELGRPLTERETEAEQIFAIRATQPPATPAFEETESVETAKRYSARMTNIETGIDDSLRAAIPAGQILSALDAGQTTGFFAPLKTFISNVLSLDSAAQQALLEKGIASLSANQITTLARGLGSMSNADRDYFAKAAPKLTDPTKANRFYAEMAIENARLAQEDRDYINERMTDGIGTRQIYIELENRRKGRKVAESVYNRVVLGISDEAARALNEAKK
jgi:hypothetical protein